MKAGSAAPLFVVNIGALGIFDNLSREHRDKYSSPLLEFL